MKKLNPRALKQHLLKISPPFFQLLPLKFSFFFLIFLHKISRFICLLSSVTKIKVVHVSEDGKHFAAITSLGFVFFVRDFERVARGEAAWSDVSLSLDIDVPASNLAFDHNRIVVVTVSSSISPTCTPTSSNVFISKKKASRALPI